MLFEKENVIVAFVFSVMLKQRKGKQEKQNIQNIPGNLFLRGGGKRWILPKMVFLRNRKLLFDGFGKKRGFSMHITGWPFSEPQSNDRYADFVGKPHRRHYRRWGGYFSEGCWGFMFEVPSVVLRSVLSWYGKLLSWKSKESRLSFPATGPPDSGTDFKAPGSLTHHQFRHLLERFSKGS